MYPNFILSFSLHENYECGPGCQIQNLTYFLSFSRGLHGGQFIDVCLPCPIFSWFQFLDLETIMSTRSTNITFPVTTIGSPGDLNHSHCITGCQPGLSRLSTFSTKGSWLPLPFSWVLKLLGQTYRCGRGCQIQNITNDFSFSKGILRWQLHCGPGYHIQRVLKKVQWGP